MAIYRYQHGDRPLDGYTIQHGLGRGGFGEVYYAVSDAGREVALKAVQNYEDIELRGIRHCMNLKHPQLVSIFDIKHNDEALPFVVMEYIDGPSLREILDQHPEGLGPAKAAFLLKEICKGLTYLHDCGVVHRDLKPHNVFYEQGVVKIGDYSLSKAMTASHRSGHTMTVGTVHYMAPEISMGRYDNTVDIYALGVLLYEMLTGRPPYEGDSMGEVLMKHVAGEVDVSGLQEPFASVIKKALAKEPGQRYQLAQEMIDDLMGHTELQTSVASLGPETLTVIAENAMKSARLATPNERDNERNQAATEAYVASPGAKPDGKVPPPPPAMRHTRPDPYANNIDLRPYTRRFTAGKALPWVLAALTFAAAGASADVGHPGPIMLAAAGWFVFLAFRWRSKRKQGKAKYQAMRKHARKNSGRPIYAAEVADDATATDDPSRESPRFANAVPPPSSSQDEFSSGFWQESPYSRLVALVMSCFALFIPIAGLQRIYVGRVKSGLLWLFTFGLLGIGQIYDTIMIALGHFRDVDGKRVLNFTKERVHSMKEPVNQYSAVVQRRWTESRIGFKLGNLIFNLFGAILLLVALAAGAVAAIDIPGAIASGAAGYQLRDEIVRETTIRDWNVLASAVLGFTTLVAGVLSAICLIFARRESTWGHMLRIPVAAAAFVGSVVLLGMTTQFGERWHTVAVQVNENYVGGALRELMMPDFWPSMICGAILFVVAVFILAWPAKRRRVVEEHAVRPAREAVSGNSREEQTV